MAGYENMAMRNVAKMNNRTKELEWQETLDHERLKRPQHHPPPEREHRKSEN